ncbi:heme NO-binding domain-containing protein [Gemmobacter serpentinus]|uniref:heme NO-binding domain-containing protein n=1 Tax=Gemmobacter serpentinus TaxID=2652247 RepID=UPI00124F1B55|nr:heme NO-binding domain-containing protein [Gemmobacter serpentinus]
MHGLMNRSIQCFLRDTYGAATWAAVARQAQLGFENFEAMLSYDDALTDAVLEAAVQVLGRARDTVLEDLGIYLVSHPERQGLRRLLRFGGVGYADFLHSLEDLPGRIRLALPEVEAPHLVLEDHSSSEYSVLCHAGLAGAGHVVVGILRAMADDYGALTLVEYQGVAPDGAERIAITLADDDFAEGRRFDLAMQVTP